ncbi:diguanylate cyclase (GGDEF)-like protein [Catenulispora sp. GAS73]|uniref:diguanylate cyclase domain-containing protein n=1 Tax=Catenulispora sp. GAS73 TaxID=3156269 RepID=UPI0035123F59
MSAQIFAAATAMALAGFALGYAWKLSQIKRMRTEAARLRRLAEHDPLTGLPNRSVAERSLKVAVGAATRCATVLLDLDDFKDVNDTWGHQVGDAQLSAVADRLTAMCTPLDALACRLAGDEFLLLIPHADRHVILNEVTAILDGLHEPVPLQVGEGIAIMVTPGASAGIAVLESGMSWTDLLHRADIALYQAKALRGRAVLFADGMRHPAPADFVHRSVRLRERHTMARVRSHAEL